jgi:signal transduction histidine kinase
MLKWSLTAAPSDRFSAGRRLRMVYREEAEMKSRTKIALVFGFGTLLIVIGFLAITSFWGAERIYRDVSAIHDTYRSDSALLDDIHTDVYIAAILTRDYLMDPQTTTAVQYQNDLLARRTSMEKHLADLALMMVPEGSLALERLRREVDVYWNLLDPIFEWDPAQKATIGYNFLQQQVIPRRKAVLSLTNEIDLLNAVNLRKEQQKINESQREFRRYVVGMSALALASALLVAGVSFMQIYRLEKRSEEERQRTEHAEQELRFLSQKLVQAQEVERKSISRELHDEIGQMLTGLKLEIRNLEELRTSPGTGFQEHLAEARNLAERTLRAVRNLAMGLRPSMLDDLGLAPALQWQVREFSRLNGIPATAEIDGDLDKLPEEVCTCVYRVVQESLTNCARHAQAKNVHVTLHGSRSRIIMTVQDDGIGFDPSSAPSRGLGLIGMEERVRELRGKMAISSLPNRGTLLEISIPMMQEGAQ